MIRPRGQNDVIVGTSLVIVSWRNKRNGIMRLVRREEILNLFYDSERLDLQTVLPVIYPISISPHITYSFRCIYVYWHLSFISVSKPYRGKHRKDKLYALAQSKSLPGDSSLRWARHAPPCRNAPQVTPHSPQTSAGWKGGELDILGVI